MADDDDKDKDIKPSWVAWLALIFVVLVIVAVIVAYVFIFVRREVQIFGLNTKIQTGATTTATTATNGTNPADSFTINTNDMYVSRNTTPLTLTISSTNTIETGKNIWVKNTATIPTGQPSSTNQITLTSSGNIRINDGGLGLLVDASRTAQLVSVGSNILLRLV